MGKRREVPHNQYIYRRRQGWYVRIAVTPSLVPIIGKTHIVRSLKTRDVTVARQRRWAAISEIRAWLEERAGTGADPVRLGLLHRERLLAASNEPVSWEHNPMNPSDVIPWTEKDFVLSEMSDTHDELLEKRGIDAAWLYQRHALSTSPLLSEVAEGWLREIAESVAGQTLSQHRYALRLFREKNPQALFVDQVDRRTAGKFVSETLMPLRKSQKTVNRIISSLSSLWKWLLKRGLAQENPWLGQGNHSRKRGQAKKDAKRPYTVHELVELLKGDSVALMGPRYGGAIHDLLRLGLLTGARLNELCKLRTENGGQQDRVIRIRGGKTPNAIRVIPVHPSVWDIIQRRARQAVESQLFPELDPQGPDLKRSWYISKRITEYRRRVLGPDDTVDFHSLRRNFATYLERAQNVSLAVNPSVIAELMGHAKGSLALSLYSGGLRLDHLQKAMDALGQVIEPEVLNAVVRPLT